MILKQKRDLIASVVQSESEWWTAYL